MSVPRVSLLVGLAMLVSMAEARVDCDPPCNPGHCCVRIWLPGRQVQHNPSLHCFPLKGEGDLCHLNEADYSCPCGEQFACQSSDPKDSMFGKCVKQ